MPFSWRSKTSWRPIKSGSVSATSVAKRRALNGKLLAAACANAVVTAAINSSNVCANDIWYYVSPTRREYAILGLRTGTGFVDVTDPYNPVVVGAITDATSIWSDMKTYSTYAYNVNEDGALTVMIVNLNEHAVTTPLVIRGDPDPEAEVWLFDAEHPAERLGVRALEFAALELPAASMTLLVCPGEGP